MPRIARVCAEGYPHHITQRGNNKDIAFFDDEDIEKTIRRVTSTVRPLGSEKFIKRLERLLKRDLFPKKSGRPKGKK